MGDVLGMPLTKTPERQVNEIRRWRDKRGLSRRELAEKIGTTAGQIQIHGTRCPDE